MKLYVEKLRESLIIPHGKDRLDSLFYIVFYAVPNEKILKIDQYLDDELRADLPKYHFDQLDAIKSDFVLDLILIISILKSSVF